MADAIAAGRPQAPAIVARAGLRDRLSDLFWRRPGVLLLLLLTPPLLWLGVIYVGSLFALLAQSFFAIDHFTGLVRYEPTLGTYAELLRPSNFDIIVRTVAMAAAVTAPRPSSRSRSPTTPPDTPAAGGRRCSTSPC